MISHSHSHTHAWHAPLSPSSPPNPLHHPLGLFSSLSAGDRVRLCLDFFQFGPTGICLLFFYPLIWLCLLYMKLKGHADLSWWHVFAPLYCILFLQPLFSCMLGTVTKICSNNAYGSSSVCYELDEGDKNTCFHMQRKWCQYLADTNSCARFIGCTLSFSCVAVLALVPTLIVMKLEGQISGSWGAAMTPLWILLGCGCLLPFTGAFAACFDDDDDDRNGVAASLFCVGIPIIVTLALLAARLQGTFIPLKYLFIAFYIVDIFLLVGVCGFCCNACCSEEGV